MLQEMMNIAPYSMITLAIILTILWFEMIGFLKIKGFKINYFHHLKIINDYYITLKKENNYELKKKYSKVLYIFLLFLVLFLINAIFIIYSF